VPDYAVALNGLSYCLTLRGEYQQAVGLSRRACEVDPNYVDARTQLGVALTSLGHFGEALEAYQASLSMNALQPEVLDRMGVAFGELNRMAEAYDAFAKAYEMAPNASRLLRKSLILSHIYPSLEAMHEERARLERGMDELLASDLRIAEPNSHFFAPAIFNLAYQGDDVLAALQKLSAVYRHLCPSLLYRAAHLDQPRPAGRKLRLAFFSAHVHDHPVTHCFSQLVNALAREADIEVYLVSYREPPKEAARRPYEQFAGRYVKVDLRPVKAREQIAALELDILVYQDIGMDDVSYFLAYSRLARRQCVMGGHPVTTGLPEMDIYLSSALGEYPGSQRHYSEQLVALDPGTASYSRPALPERYKSRVELGLPVSGHLYVCPMMLQKIHPEFDDAVAQILSLDEQGHVVFFDHPHAGWERDLRARLMRRLGERLGQRLHFLPFVRDRNDFAAINLHASVVLDPFHFGIGSTAITTFAVGTPVVTWPGEFLRGRGAFIYAQLLKVPECVAESRQQYPALAVRIASDSALREDLKRRILEHADSFYESEQYIRTSREYFEALGRVLVSEQAPGAA
jgi:predicted O-linked N-acetylglucosamine transferase (SPINDLY family)